jgi:HEAT repeat protein
MKKQLPVIDKPHRSIVIGILLLILYAFPSPGTCNLLPREKEPQTKWALIIAADQYLDNRLAPLTDAVKSSQEIAGLLKKRYGYRQENVIEIYNEAVTATRINEVLAFLGKQIGRNDVFFAFVSTHTVKGEKGDQYLATYDGSVDQPWTLVSEYNIQEFLNNLRAQSVFLTIAGCFATERLSLERYQKLRYSADPYWTFQILNACAQPDGGAAQRSEFAAHFIAALGGEAANADGAVTVTNLHAYLQKRFYGAVRLEKFQGRSGGDFFFSPAPALVIAPPLPETDQLNPALVRQLDKANSLQSRIAAISDLLKEVLATPEGRRQEVTDQFALLMRQVVADATEDSQVRSRAAWALGQLKDRVSIPDAALLYLRAELDNADPNTRVAAIHLLAELKDPESEEKILKLAQTDGRLEVRLAALEAIKQMRLPADQVMPLLLPVLQEREPDLRRSAINALATFKDQRSVAAILQVLKNDSAPGVRVASAYALGRIVESGGLQSSDRMSVEKALIRALEKDDQGIVREAAASTLDRIGGTESEKKLVDALEDKDPKVRTAAATALGHKRNADAAKTLSKILLKDASPEVRRAAAIALGQIGGQHALESLLYAVKDENVYVRTAAQKALEQIKTVPAHERYHKALEDPSPRVRIEAAQKLAEAGDADAVPDLIKLLGDNDYTVRQTAIKSLKVFTDEASQQKLIAALKDENFLKRQGAAAVLGLIGNPQAVEPLVASSRDFNSAVRVEVITALGKIRDERAMEAIFNAAKDHDASVRQAAAVALGNFSSPEVSKQLESLAGDDDPNVRQAAIEVLKRSSYKK